MPFNFQGLMRARNKHATNFELGELGIDVSGNKGCNFNMGPAKCFLPKFRVAVTFLASVLQMSESRSKSELNSYGPDRAAAELQFVFDV